MIYSSVAPNEPITRSQFDELFRNILDPNGQPKKIKDDDHFKAAIRVEPNETFDSVYNELSDALDSVVKKKEQSATCLKVT